VAIGVAVTGAGVWASQKTASIEQSSLRTESKAEHQVIAIPSVVARVNGMPITREQLAERCLAKYGSKELEPLIAMVVLDNACKRRGISVSDAEIEAEASRLAQSLGQSTADLYKTLLEQKGMSKDEYLHDVVAANLKLSKLGVDSNFRGGKSVLRGIIEQLEGRADIELIWSQTPHSRDEALIKSPPPTQEDRLRGVEKTLGQVLRTLEELKRPAGSISR
jgi:hypothetical protein